MTNKKNYKEIIEILKERRKAYIPFSKINTPERAEKEYNLKTAFPEDMAFALSWLDNFEEKVKPTQFLTSDELKIYNIFVQEIHAFKKFTIKRDFAVMTIKNETVITAGQITDFVLSCKRCDIALNEKLSVMEMSRLVGKDLKTKLN